jgi:cytosol alanyl aminopeptidase
VAIVVACGQTLAVRAIAICAALAACGRPEVQPVPPRSTAAAFAAPATAVSPGPGAASGDGAAALPAWRLPEGVAPLGYDVTLELDPDRMTFKGHVVISLAVADPGTTELWLHGVGLELSRARLRRAGRDEELALPRPDDHQRLRFALPHPVGSDRVALVIDYAGRAGHLSARTSKGGTEGLFRREVRGRWYLFSQSQSIFARRIVPCLDEPRFKSAWRVTAIVPRAQIALGNAPIASERVLSDGRREVRFAEIERMPSYLLALAVGPFDIVDAGKLGRARVPCRIAVQKGDAGRAQLAVRELPRVVATLERYLDSPLPSAKLDLVAVPGFFGAMENIGLITFNSELLAARHIEVEGFGFAEREVVSVMAHELAHQWFGNLVTPASWDHLWLSEAFATWLAAHTVTELRGRAPAAIAHRGRAHALAADERTHTRPLVHAITSADDIERAFDAIAYEKGNAILAAFERYVGPDPFRAALRRYVTRHAGTSVTSDAFVEALAATTRPEVGHALASNLVHPGTPVVELELRCAGAPTLTARTRGAVTVPVCVRAPVGARGVRSCLLAGGHSELALPAGAGCPAWVVANDGGTGYYRAVWRGDSLRAPVAAMSAEERLVHGDDVAFGVLHGDHAIAPALAELAALAGPDDVEGQLAALAIAEAIDPIVADDVRPVWTAWLAARYAGRLSPAVLAPSSSWLVHVLRGRLVPLVRSAIAPAVLAAARKSIDSTRKLAFDATTIRLAAVRDPEPLFERFVQAAATTKRHGERVYLLRMLGEFPRELAPRLIEVMLDRRFEAAQVWQALEAMLAHSATTSAAWQALRPQLSSVLGALRDERADVIAATRSLCDAGARAEVVAGFAPHVAGIAGGRRALERALASIDRCIARRAAIGDLASALAAVPSSPAMPVAPASGALTTPP